MPAKQTALALSFFTALAGTAYAEEYPVGQLVISDPYAYATPSTAKTGAGYMTIYNDGKSDDRLIGIESEFPRSELHITEVDSAGVASMVHVDGIDIPAGGSIVLAPQEAHIMFMGLNGPLSVGDTIAATLEFEQAGKTLVSFGIKTRP